MMPFLFWNPLTQQRVYTSSYKGIKREVVFMFPGQGSQYLNMGRELYQTETLFKDQIDHCASILQRELRIGHSRVGVLRRDMTP